MTNLGTGFPAQCKADAPATKVEATCSKDRERDRQLMPPPPGLPVPTQKDGEDKPFPRSSSALDGEYPSSSCCLSNQKSGVGPFRLFFALKGACDLCALEAAILSAWPKSRLGNGANESARDFQHSTQKAAPSVVWRRQGLFKKNPLASEPGHCI
ncbi:unnamed protein product, partial [Staurois parvus]